MRVRTASGFTLIEMLVVLVILGVVTGVSVPVFRDWTEPDTLVDAAVEISSVLRGARMVALERGVVVEVSFVPELGSYRAWVHGDDGLPLREGTLRRLGAAQMSSADERPRFRFDPTGTAGGEPLVVMGEAGRSVRILVDRWTGQVRVDG